MSNSEVPVIIKEDKEKPVNSEISKRLLIRSELEDKCHQQQKEANKWDHNDESGTSVNSPVKEVVVHDEEEEKEEDGFKTPTSLDHKIPVGTECPPAPRKPRPSRKRKASSSPISDRPRGRLVRFLDLAQVVNSLYNNPTDFQGKINYSRKDS